MEEGTLLSMHGYFANSVQLCKAPSYSANDTETTDTESSSDKALNESGCTAEAFAEPQQPNTANKQLYDNDVKAEKPAEKFRFRSFLGFLRR